MQILSVKVVPNAKYPRVEKHNASHFTVYVSQPAEKGKANKAMILQLSQYLHVHQNDLILSKGDRSNLKTVVLSGRATS